MDRSVCWSGLLCWLALMSCGQGLGQDRDTALALLEGAEALIQQGNCEKALGICDRALALDAQCPAVHFKKARCYEKMRSYEDAYLAFLKAEQLAKGEKDENLAREVRKAIDTLSPGLGNLEKASERLLAKLLALGEEALVNGHLETAQEIFGMILRQWPAEAVARRKHEEVGKEIEARGDPIRTMIAEAMLAEIWYLVGAGQREAATGMAQDLGRKYAKLPAGQEAERLLSTNFALPGKDETASLKKRLATRKSPPPGAAAQPAAPGATPAKAATPASPAKPVPPAPPPLDLDALEGQAQAEAGRLGKGELLAKFREAYSKGMEFYRNARPGSDGNQQNLRNALEQFARCEALCARAAKEAVDLAPVSQDQQQASLLKYACLKMMVLSHG